MVDLNKEIVFASSLPEVAREISHLVDSGKLRKIAPRLYTTNLIDSPEHIIRRNILSILMWRFPKTIISHRSACEMRTTPSGHFFLTGKVNRKITELPGVIIHILKGPDADEKDMIYGQMYIASEYRWLLENMQSSRKHGEESKTLPQETVEKKIGSVFVAGGEKALNEYRDTLRNTAKRLGMHKEFQKINIIISAILSTHTYEVLKSPVIKKMSTGLIFDEKRQRLFETVFAALQYRHFPSNPIIPTEQEYRNIAFFESYFSNYIEGTEFEIDEAKQIVDSGIPIPNRNEDSHDILGTFNVVSNRQEMNKYPTSSQELVTILCHRHSILLAGKPDLQPGHFKEKNNRAGNTEFVDAKLVLGTLDIGYSYYAALTNPTAKAIYMMFLISEIHPFNDGNGRIARMMMNSELSRMNEAKIIIPTVCREDYLLSLRKLSRHSDPDAYIRTMEKMQQFSRTLYGKDFPSLLSYLYQCNAFTEPAEGKLKFNE